MYSDCESKIWALTLLEQDGKKARQGSREVRGMGEKCKVGERGRRFQ